MWNIQLEFNSQFSEYMYFCIHVYLPASWYSRFLCEFVYVETQILYQGWR